MEEYTFKIDGLRTKHSKPEIVASLQRYAQHRGGDTIRTREYDEWSDRLVSSRTICDIFGSWGKGLQAAGLRGERTARLQFREMIAAFRHVGESTMRRRRKGNWKHIWRNTNIPSGGPAIVARMEDIWSWLE